MLTKISTAILLHSSLVAAMVSKFPPLFPLDVFGAQTSDFDLPQPNRQQTIAQFPGVHYPPRTSTPDFPGDETGSSPFFYCPESDPDTDLFAISKIVLNPNPPRINFIFVFHAHGYFREPIIEHPHPFRVRTTVRNEDRDGVDFTLDRDFCDFVDMLEMDGRSTICPPYQGNGTIHKFEFVDFGISQANYSLKIDVIGNGKRVFCVQSWFDLITRGFD